MNIFQAPMAKCKATVGQLGSNVYDLILILKSKDMQPFIDGSNKRVICMLNKDNEVRSGLMSYGDGDFYLILNKRIQKNMDLEPGDPLEVEVIKDESEYGMDFPEEFQQALDLEPEALKYFLELSMAKRRNLIYLVNKVKRPETRIKKALVISEYLRDCRGALDFRELNEAFKKANS